MDVALLGARLLLIAVLGVAGIAKLADLEGSRRAVEGFGISPSISRSVGSLLPLSEIAVAIALIFHVTAWWGALAAFVLLLFFIGGISVNLARGRTPDCHCFGQLHSEPVSPLTLLRNVLLGVVALIVVTLGRGNPGPGVFDWFGTLTVSERAGIGAAGIVIALLAAQLWLLVETLREHRRLVLKVEELGRRIEPGEGAVLPSDGTGLQVGAPAPDFNLHDVDGSLVTLKDLLKGGTPAMLVFTDSHCGPCTALLTEIMLWQIQYAGRLTIAILSNGLPSSDLPEKGQERVSHLLLDEHGTAAQSYQVYGTPGAVAVRADGTVARPAALGADAIRTLVGDLIGTDGPAPITLLPQAPPRTFHHAVEASELKAGDPVPDVRLVDLMGHSVRLWDFVQRQTLVVFWSSMCGFCREMLPDLKAWEIDPPPGAPSLLVILPGVSEANQVVPFRAPALIDAEFAAAHAFNAFGTPSAVLIGSDGRLQSDVVAGAEAVTALANGEPRSTRQVSA
jgi:peroxiredoxin/uncharacterized membrane protein YphA (DoxX/SURF4 family)